MRVDETGRVKLDLGAVLWRGIDGLWGARNPACRATDGDVDWRPGSNINDYNDRIQKNNPARRAIAWRRRELGLGREPGRELGAC